MSDVLILNRDAQPLSLLPLSVVSWQTAVRLLAIEKVFVLEEYDDWEVHSPTTTMKVPSVVMTTEYVKWKTGPKFTKSNVYLRDEFTCQLCGDQFESRDLTYEHVKPRSHGGKTNWHNIVAACSPCNSKKGNDASILPKRMPYKPEYFELVGKRKKYPIYISDEKWKLYLDWPDELIRFKGQHK